MKRGSGILLHVSSLPSRYGIGDLGHEAYKFVDLMAQGKQRLWQILPVNPTNLACASSPYHSISAFAGNSLFINPDMLIEDGLLEKKDLNALSKYPMGKVDYEKIVKDKIVWLDTAYENFLKKGKNSAYRQFVEENNWWLADYALFTALKEFFKGKVWCDWPDALQHRNEQELEKARKKLIRRIEKENFIQYIFFKQWFALKKYCSEKGVQIIGDIPIYVQYDSVEVWSNPSVFKLDKDKKPYVVAGVPPDYFSATGQLWGNPLYNWDVLKNQGYDWWVKRFEHNFKMMDIVRIDHFRGMVACWEIPAGEKTAMNGKWNAVPARDFLNTLLNRFSCFPVIAEDLGYISEDVKEVMRDYGFPGMKILLFGFGGDLATNPYLPHNLEKNCVIYTGTHDNNTTRGWIEKEARKEDKERLFAYLGYEINADELPLQLIRLAMMSVADIAIIPMQDILGLGGEARMNLPATVKGNWQWRLKAGQFTASHAEELRLLTEIYNRAGLP